MKWGAHDDEARARIATITLEEMQQAGVTREMAQAWEDFYRNELIRTPQNPSVRGRIDLMEYVVKLFDGAK